MGLYDQFKTDAAKENDGVAVVVGTNDNDGSEIKFMLARTGKSNKEYTKLLAATFKPHQRALDMKTMSDALAAKLMRDVFIGSVLKGWQNVQDESGAPIPFTKENAAQLFDKLPELYDDLEARSKDISLFRVGALENEAGN